MISAFRFEPQKSSSVQPLQNNELVKPRVNSDKARGIVEAA